MRPKKSLPAEENNPGEAGEDLIKARYRAETNVKEKIPTGTSRLPDYPGEQVTQGPVSQA